MTRLGLSMLVAYSEEYVVLETKESVPARNAAGDFVGLLDFEAHELAGGEMTDIWIVEQVRRGPGAGPPVDGWEVCPGGWLHGLVEGSPNTPEPCPGGEQRRMARGSKTWREWVDCRGWIVELEGPAGAKRIAALVNPKSGYRRERAPIEAEIDRRLAAAIEEAVELQSAMAVHLLEEGAERDEAVELAMLIEPEANLIDLLGGPDTPLLLDADGRTVSPIVPTGAPGHLPLAGGGRVDDPVQPSAGAEGDRADEPAVDGAIAIAPRE